MLMNPNMELLIQRVLHSETILLFKFKINAPRGQTEAENIIKIIRFFKQGSAPLEVQI